MTKTRTITPPTDLPGAWVPGDAYAVIRIVSEGVAEGIETQATLLAACRARDVLRDHERRNERDPAAIGIIHITDWEE